MNDSKISVRYAKAIFKLAVEQKKLSKINDDMKLIFGTCKNDMFKEFLHSPIISISKKQEVLKSLFTGKVNKETLSLLNILAQNRRETYIELVSMNFFTFYREYLGIKEVTLTTVNPISLDYKEQIINILKDTFKSKIDLKENVDKDIIGGFVLKIEDQEIDASVATKLNTIKKELTASDF